MKSKLAILIIVVAMVFVSCKSDEKKSEQSAQDVGAVEDYIFKVRFQYIATQDDNFHVYYTEDQSIDFNEEQSVWAQIKGSEQPQEVVFNLPEGVMPTNLRVDFGYGANPKQSEIVLKNFGMQFNDRTFTADGVQIFNYFYGNPANAIVDKTTGSLKRLTPDNSTAPSIYPHTTLADEIAKLVN